MAGFEIYPEMISILLCLILFSFYLRRLRRRKKVFTPTNWPIAGMMPVVIQNIHCLHDFITKFLEENGGTFIFKGPWFSNLDMVFTSDPSNIHHILTKNFPNYPKGPEFRKTFDIFGDGIIAADSELWEFHRRTLVSMMHQPSFRNAVAGILWKKVNKALLPVLEKYAKGGATVDLQDIILRFNFDNMSMLFLDHDPESLSLDLPSTGPIRAFDDIMEAVLHRNLLPESWWKFQRSLGIGRERKLREAWEAFDEYIYSCVGIKEEKMKKAKDSGSSKDLDCLKTFMEAYKRKPGASHESKVFLRDILINMMLAGRDTTATTVTWLLWLLSKNPSAEMRIREEIRTKLQLDKGKRWRPFNAEESRDLVYLHGALCESLRLYPPAPLELKTPVEADVLPSGHHVHTNTKLLLSFYSMGRMESIWGKDCSEFKPERWINERQEIKHEPSFKFPAFHAGPRTCIGKDVAFVQMKMLAATIIYNYNIHVVEGHPIVPSASIVILMKHGFLVRLSRRN